MRYQAGCREMEDVAALRRAQEPRALHTAACLRFLASLPTTPGLDLRTRPGPRGAPFDLLA